MMLFQTHPCTHAYAALQKERKTFDFGQIVEFHPTALTMEQGPKSRHAALFKKRGRKTTFVRLH